jgi:hypothetical protein
MKNGKRRIVEECEVVTERSPGPCLAAVYAAQGTNPLFSYTRCNYGGDRRWLLCPRCFKRVAKLYRPLDEVLFACRQCHQLTYRSAQCHDARLDRLLKASDEILQQMIASPKNNVALLGIKATFIRFRLIDKY